MNPRAKGKKELKDYCIQRLKSLAASKKMLAESTVSKEAKAQLIGDVCIRIAEIEGFLFLLSKVNHKAASRAKETA